MRPSSSVTLAWAPDAAAWRVGAHLRPKHLGGSAALRAHRLRGRVASTVYSKHDHRAPTPTHPRPTPPGHMQCAAEAGLLLQPSSWRSCRRPPGGGCGSPRRGGGCRSGRRVAAAPGGRAGRRGRGATPGGPGGHVPPLCGPGHSGHSPDPGGHLALPAVQVSRPAPCTARSDCASELHGTLHTWGNTPGPAVGPCAHCGRQRRAPHAAGHAVQPVACRPSTLLLCSGQVVSRKTATSLKCPCASAPPPLPRLPPQLPLPGAPGARRQEPALGGPHCLRPLAGAHPAWLVHDGG